MRMMMLALVLVGGCASKDVLKKAEQDGELLRFELAQTYVKKGAYTVALPLVQRVAQEHPELPQVRTLHGTVLRERSLYLQAEHEYQAALARAPGHAPAYAGLGITYDLMKRHADAERAHRKSLELAPNDASYWNNLGFSQYLAGHNDEAIKSYEHALGLDASQVVTYNNLGFAYGRKHDFENARRCFHAALGETSGNLNLALAYEQNGDAATGATLREEAMRQLPREALR